MSTPKVSKKSSYLFECEICGAVILQKDSELHKSNCPCSISNFTHSFIINNCLYSRLETTEKDQENSLLNSEFFIFLSEPVIQLCAFKIGDWTVVTPRNGNPVAKIIWPSNEKSLMSIILTKKGMENFPGKENEVVLLENINYSLSDAREIILIPISTLNIPVCPELINRIQNTYLDKLLTTKNKVNIFFFGKKFQFEVREISRRNTNDIQEELKMLELNECNNKFFKVTSSTSWKIICTEEEFIKEKVKKNILNNIGGLDKEINEIKELVTIALGKLNYIPGLQIIRSVLLYGSPGNGKTCLATALAKSFEAYVVNINITEIYSSKDKSPEENLTAFYEEACIRSPSIIVIDDIDTLCPSRTAKLNDSEKRVSASLFKIFEALYERQDLKIFVIATTNKLDSLDRSLRRSGRLDKEIEIPIPCPEGRLQIIQKMLKDSSDCGVEDLKQITDGAHGFVGSDLEALCSTAALHAARLNKKTVELEDLKYGLVKTVPSAMREVQIEVPNVKWNDIGGQHKLKLSLKQAVEWPLKHPDVFTRMGISPPKGVLMFGPPGCSKTMIAKALATESNLNFLSIKGPELFSKWVGESERAVREVFRKARQVSPSIIFFDEIDAIGSERTSGSTTSVQERVLAQLLTELDGVTPLGDVTVVAATNRPDRIDRALLRPGRLDRIIYVPLPDSYTRLEIFKLKFSKMPVLNVDADELVKKSEGYSGAEVNAICHEAAMMALEENIEAERVEMKHFLAALDLIKPRTADHLLKIYESFLKQ